MSFLHMSLKDVPSPKSSNMYRAKFTLIMMTLAAIALTACSSAAAPSPSATTPANESATATGQTPRPTASLQSDQTAPTQQSMATEEPEPTKATMEATEPSKTASTGNPIGSNWKQAPELEGLTGWINSEPFEIQEQLDQGNVVLIDFWTYTCVNCLRTIPYLKEWHEKYSDNGLVILGVHAPEFEFEEIPENVVNATEELGIEWAIAQDNEMDTWGAFNNRFWPAKYLIDINGNIRYEHFGEGEYSETEQQIRLLLQESGHDILDITPNTKPEPEVDPEAAGASQDKSTTRELYAGFQRNYGALVARTQPPYILNREYYDQPETEINYDDPGDHRNHFLYLEGLWRNEMESIVHARSTEQLEDYIGLKFFGTSVNAVMSSENGDPLDVFVILDGLAIPKDRAGEDVMYDTDGNSYVHVNEAKMFRIIDQPTFGSGEMILSSNSPDFALFAFTFGSYEGGEPGQ